MCGNPIYLKHTIMHVAVAFGRIQLNSLHEVLFCLTLASLKKKKRRGKKRKDYFNSVSPWSHHVQLQFPNSRHQRKTTTIIATLNLSKYDCLSVRASFVVSYFTLQISRLRKKCVQHHQCPRSKEMAEVYCKKIYCKGLGANMELHTFPDMHQLKG